MKKVQIRVCQWMIQYSYWKQSEQCWGSKQCIGV